MKSVVKMFTLCFLISSGFLLVLTCCRDCSKFFSRPDESPFFPSAFWRHIGKNALSYKEFTVASKTKINYTAAKCDFHISKHTCFQKTYDWNSIKFSRSKNVFWNEGTYPEMAWKPTIPMCQYSCSYNCLVHMHTDDNQLFLYTLVTHVLATVTYNQIITDNNQIF